MSYQPNIGQAFPLESLGSDIARNSFNYQSILNGLVEWNMTSNDSVMIRLAKDSYPWYEDFTIPSKQSISKTNEIISYLSEKVNENCFAVSSLLNIAAYGGDQLSSDAGDIITLRLNMVNNGNTQWDVFYAPLVHEWKSGINIRVNNYYSYQNKIYLAKTSIESVISPDIDTETFDKYITEWVGGSAYKLNQLVLYENNIYIATVDMLTSGLNPSDSMSLFKFYLKGYSENTDYKKGDYVFYENNFYLLLKDSINVDPTDETYWKNILLVKDTTYTSMSKSFVYRIFANIDIIALILFNSSSDSSSLTNISLQYSIKTLGNPSIYQRSTDVFNTVNYTNYPLDKSPIWSELSPISNTDDKIDITTRQPYSASMVFDHANQVESRTINFINYDGPDLDQGLCIYLQIESELMNNEIVEPEDGYTYEFYFRIWPNEKYTNALTRDHIVNKSQIYVYSALNKSAIANSKCSTPIAKFSMARMTNFHVFAENITIPDKPVVYRATFIYSKQQHEWMLYDYYQLPDHVFVGPIGFIDPANPSAGDRFMGNINKDVVNVGYETSALPTYTDVFSRPDLKPYKSSDGNFYKRTI